MIWLLCSGGTPHTVSAGLKGAGVGLFCTCADAQPGPWLPLLPRGGGCVGGCRTVSRGCLLLKLQAHDVFSLNGQVGSCSSAAAILMPQQRMPQHAQLPPNTTHTRCTWIAEAALTNTTHTCATMIAMANGGRAHHTAGAVVSSH